MPHHLLLPAVLIILLQATVRLPAVDHDPATDWFKDARLGVFMHFLPKSSEQFALVERFDAQALADQLAAMGAKYLVFTMYQNAGFFNAPSAAYERITGYRSGERCAVRDLPMDLHRALSAKGIRLMVYVTGQTPNGDPRAQQAFGLPGKSGDQKIGVDFATRWAEVLQEWSDRYGDRVAGWWFDGCYQWIGFNDGIAHIYADAVRYGNPRTLVAFNPGVKLPVIRATRSENFTAGELDKPFQAIPTSRWLDGAQWHALTYLGSRWAGREVRHTAQEWTAWVAFVAAKGGVVTLDCGPNWDAQAGPIGSVAPAQAALVRSIADTLPH